MKEKEDLHHIKKYNIHFSSTNRLRVLYEFVHQHLTRAGGKVTPIMLSPSGGGGVRGRMLQSDSDSDFSPGPRRAKTATRRAETRRRRAHTEVSFNLGEFMYVCLYLCLCMSVCLSKPV